MHQPEGGQLRDVAVKIQHPGVIDSAFMDLNIVPSQSTWHVASSTDPAAAVCACLPLRPCECQSSLSFQVWKLVEFSEKFLHMTMPFDRRDGIW